MTTTLDDTDVDWLKLIDFDTEIACEEVSIDCDLAVEWKITSTCCGTTALLCSLHKDVVVMKILKMLSNPRWSVSCRICGRKFDDAVSVEDIFIIVPL